MTFEDGRENIQLTDHNNKKNILYEKKWLKTTLKHALHVFNILQINRKRPLATKRIKLSTTEHTIWLSK